MLRIPSLITLALLLLGCGPNASGEQVVDSEQHRFVVETMAEGLVRTGTAITLLGFPSTQGTFVLSKTELLHRHGCIMSSTPHPARAQGTKW